MITWQSFNLLNEANLLRIICGLFFIPHLFGKFVEREFVRGYFSKAGFNPPMPFVYFSLVAETIFTVGLILNIYTVYVAALAAIHLLVAAWATARVAGNKWIWSLGGYEYCVFWALCCVIVAMHAYRVGA